MKEISCGDGRNILYTRIQYGFRGDIASKFKREKI